MSVKILTHEGQMRGGSEGDRKRDRHVQKDHHSVKSSQSSQVKSRDVDLHNGLESEPATDLDKQNISCFYCASSETKKEVTAVIIHTPASFLLSVNSPFALDLGFRYGPRFRV